MFMASLDDGMRYELLAHPGPARGVAWGLHGRRDHALSDRRLIKSQKGASGISPTS